MFDWQTLEVKFETHPHPISFTVGEARRKMTVRCPQCGQPVKIEGGPELDRTLREAEKQLRDLGFK